MTTYGIMQDRIADETDRDDNTSQIKLAIQTAIKHYEAERFWFNEGLTTFTTATASEAYSVTVVLEFDAAVVYINGHPCDLIPITYAELVERRDPNYKGQPTQYAVFNDRMYLNPIPQQTYTIEVSGCLQLSTLTATADSNAWMVAGEELIRYAAKEDLYRNIERDTESADEMGVQKERALARLQNKTTSKITSNRVRPTDF